MNIVELNNLVRKISLSCPLVNSYYNMSPYECWNTKEVKYGSVVMDVTNVSTNTATSTYQCLFYYGDRLTESKTNKNSVRTDAITVLDSIISKLYEQEGVSISFSNNYTLFEQKFEDELCGAYVTVDVQVMGDGLCGFDIDMGVGSDFGVEQLHKTIKENGLYEWKSGKDKYYDQVVMNVDVEIPEFTTETLTETITTNGIYNYTPTTDGYSQVDITVNVEGSNGSNIDFSMIYDNDTNDKILQKIRGDIEYTKSIELPPNTNTIGVYEGNRKMVYSPQYWNDGTIFGSGSTSMNRTFSNCTLLQYVPMIDTSNVTGMNSMFEECMSLPTIPELDTSNVIDMGYMFGGCSLLQTIPQLDTSNVRSMQGMFSRCKSLSTIPQLNTSNVTSMSNMFLGCDSLSTIPQLDTSNVTSMSSMFFDCYSLQTIPQLDTSNVTDMWGVVRGCRSLLNLGGFKNLKVSLDLSQCTNLTHDSLVNVIDGLATVTQSTELKLGTTNLSKLTPDEIEIATNKGWTVS